jgi:L-rhamnose-H+ transport protein
MAITLGYCAASNTVIPPVWEGKIRELMSQHSGPITLSGVAVCLLGISVCGWAGIRKEKELSDEDKKATIQKFSFIAELDVAQGVAPCGSKARC